jgi:hypothetical protein
LTVTTRAAHAAWLLGLVALALSGCSRVLGIEEARVQPGTAGVSGAGVTGGSGGEVASNGDAGAGGGASNGTSGSGATAGSVALPGGGMGGTASCPIGMVNLDGQCCPLPVVGGACNIPACGCAGGQICGVDKPATGLQCFAGAGLAIGQSCSDQSCVTGAGCFGGVCKPYCQTDGDCAAIAGLRYCRATTWSSTGETIAGVNVCAVMCDPARPQSPRAPLRACPAGYRCWFANDSRYSDCVAGGTAVAGQPCPTGNECSAGHYCTVRASCNRACGSAADCVTGEGCLEFSAGPVALGGLKVGYCGNCDPARPDAPRTGLYGCPSGYTCALVTSSVFECLKSKALGGEGDPCPNLHADCKPGYYCTSTTKTCHRYCADATDCGGTGCYDFSIPITTSGQRVASCPTT